MMNREQEFPDSNVGGEKQKKRSTWSWKNTVGTILAVCLINSVAWVALHGVPLFGLPKVEEVEQVSITSGAEEKIVTDPEDLELLVNAANLLNYRLWGQTQGEPEVTLTYFLTNGETVSISANETTMWWHGKAHPIHEERTFVNIIQGLFFDLP